MRQVKTLEELRDLVIANGGVLTIEMRVLRNAYGAQRLGAQIRENISDKLRGLGIGHVDDPLPELKEYEVRLFQLGSPVGRLIEAVLHPGPSNDEQLREAASGGDAEKLARIREIACD